MKHLYGYDQFGNQWGPLDPKAPKKSLLRETCRVSAAPMYRDTAEGGAIQTGYVVSPVRGYDDYPLWVELYFKETTLWTRGQS